MIGTTLELLVDFQLWLLFGWIQTPADSYTFGAYCVLGEVIRYLYGPGGRLEMK